MRRDHVASTLIRRNFNVVCPLGLFRDWNSFPYDDKSVNMTDFFKHNLNQRRKNYQCTYTLRIQNRNPPYWTSKSMQFSDMICLLRVGLLLTPLYVHGDAVILNFPVYAVDRTKSEKNCSKVLPSSVQYPSCTC